MKSSAVRSQDASLSFRPKWRNLLLLRLASPLVWWAILLIIASFISWLYVLRYIPLAIAFPLSRVVDILVPLGCWIFLGELISTLRWCGIALVVIGLALVAKPIAQIEERL